MTDSAQRSSAGPGRRSTARSELRGRGLTLDVVVTATLSLIDTDGIGAASMRTVASRLGVEAQSLYSHVSSRGDLLDAVVDRIVNELSDDPEVSFLARDGWRPYLTDLARGVRRYARAHPHAFPLVATRPAEAPWINPPLRSLRWIEAFLRALRADGFSEEQTLFAYRTFNSYLLGFLLLETGAMTVDEPRPGDGSFAASGGPDREGTTDPDHPVPGGLSPTRTVDEQRALRAADTPHEVVDPLGAVDAERYPTVHELAVGLAQEFYDEEFELGLADLLARIAAMLAT